MAQKKRGGRIKRFIIKAVIMAILYACGLGWLVTWLTMFTGCSAAEMGGKVVRPQPTQEQPSQQQQQPAQEQPTQYLPIPATPRPFTPTLATNATFTQSTRLPYGTTLKIAEETGRPWMVMLTATWCEPCKQLKSGPLTQLWKERWLDDRGFLCSVVDIDQQKELAKHLDDGSNSVPQMIVYWRRDDKWVMVRERGFMPIDRLRAFLSKARANAGAKKK